MVRAVLGEPVMMDALGKSLASPELWSSLLEGLFSEWEPSPAEVTDLFSSADKLAAGMRAVMPDVASIEGNESMIAYWARHYGSSGEG